MESRQQVKMSIEQVENSPKHTIEIETPLKAQLKKCCLIEGCEQIENYKNLNRIHQGTYGTVYRALELPTGNICAIKKLKMKEGQDFPITSLREISILRSLCHPNISKITRVAISNCRTKVYIIMEYVENELKDLLSHIVFTEPQIKKLMRDLLDGTAYLHSRNIVHRDMKSSNLLYSNQGRLKICDFGLARKLASVETNLTQEVITMWYRPPELLVGAEKYSLEVDIWSIGCIMAELASKTQFFKGTTEIDQLDLIFKAIGSPTEESWPEFKQHKKAHYMAGKRFNGNKLRQLIPKAPEGLSDLGISLLSQLLTANPNRRVTAEKALKHPWFNEQPSTCSQDQMPRFSALNDNQRSKNRPAPI